MVAADDPHEEFRIVPDTLTIAQLRRELSGLREVLVARLDGMDRATELLSETVNRTPTEIQKEIGHLSTLVDEKFDSVDLRFDERDVRTEQAAKASKEALDAALLAAKELVSQQNEANAATNDKTEQSTIKQIDQIGIRIDTMQKGFDDRVTELKERIDRGEPATAAAALAQSGSRADATYAQSSGIASAAQTRATIASVTAALSLVVAIVAVFVLITHG